MSEPHQVAVSAFNSNHESYDQLRPDFDPLIVDHFLKDLKLIENGGALTDKKILELAAGTGKFTKNLVNHGWKDNLIIVEPSEGMLQSFVKNFPGIETHLSSSYNIPLGDNSVDAILVAQGFHWFADLQSLKEIKRVLKPDGVFGCIWNFDGNSTAQKTPEPRPSIDYVIDPLIANEVSIDKSEDPFEVSDRVLGQYSWNKKLTDYMYSFDVALPQYRQGKWRKVLADNEFFSPVEKENFFYRKYLVAKNLVYDYWLTRSFITKLPQDEREEIKKKVNDIIEGNITDKDIIDKNGNIYLQRIMGTHTIIAKPI